MIELKTLLDKEKMLVTSIFSFSHNVFRKRISQGHKKNMELFGKGLNVDQVIVFFFERAKNIAKMVSDILVSTIDLVTPFSERTNFRLSEPEDNNFKFDRNGRKFFK